MVLDAGSWAGFCLCGFNNLQLNLPAGRQAPRAQRFSQRHSKDFFDNPKG